MRRQNNRINNKTRHHINKNSFSVKNNMLCNGFGKNIRNKLNQMTYMLIAGEWYWYKNATKPLQNLQ